MDPIYEPQNDLEMVKLSKNASLKSKKQIASASESHDFRLPHTGDAFSAMVNKFKNLADPENPRLMRIQQP
jgi:hypothetical protein